MPIPEYITNIIKELLTTVKDVMPTPEAKAFITSAQDYLVKKLKQEKVDDIEALKNIYLAGVKAVNSILAMLRSHTGAPDDMKNMLENMVSFNFHL